MVWLNRDEMVLPEIPNREPDAVSLDGLHHLSDKLITRMVTPWSAALFFMQLDKYSAWSRSRQNALRNTS